MIEVVFTDAYFLNKKYLQNCRLSVIYLDIKAVDN
jgi:hypothetical protein